MNLGSHFRRKKPHLTKDQVYASRPVRNPNLRWERDEAGLVVLSIPRRADGLGKILTIVFVVPKSRSVQLDEVGSFVWQLCDGVNSIREMIRKLGSEYKLNRKEADVSLTTYLRDLAKRGIVGFEMDRDGLEPEVQRALELGRI